MTRIEKIDGGLSVKVSYADWRGGSWGDIWHEYRRIDGRWQMLGDSGTWFDHEPTSDVLAHVHDYENPLRQYGFNEGPAYPRANKKGDVGGFFRNLQAKELAACTKNIFGPVKLKYDASAENRARVNREVATRMRAPFSRDRLVGN